MTRTFIQTLEFSSNWDRLGLNDDDLRALGTEIVTEHDKIPVIPGTGGLRKFRIIANNHGKRGGARVCYVDFVLKETIYLITVYSKNEKENLSEAEKKRSKK